MKGRQASALLLTIIGSFLLPPDCRAQYADEQFAQIRNNPILHLQAEDLLSLLCRLTEVRHRLINGEEIELPLVSINAGAKTFRGSVLDVNSRDSKDPIVLMEIAEGEGRFEGTKLAYIKLSAIASLEIHEAGSKKTQATMDIGSPELPAPTKIDLKRKMANFSTWLSDKSGKAISYTMDLASLPADDKVLTTIGSVMNETTGALSEMLLSSAADNTKFKKELTGVTFVAAKNLDVKYSDGVVTISIDAASPSYHRGELSVKLRALASFK